MKPYKIVDNSGMRISESESNMLVRKLLDYVLVKTRKLSDDSVTAVRITEYLQSAHSANGSPTGIAWKLGLTADLSDLDSRVLAKSRILKLIQHRTITEVMSYINNNDKRKNRPTMTKLKMNLGAVDSQMATVKFDAGSKTIALDWKCWTKQLTLFFKLPEYILEYDITKFCLPTVEWNDKSDTPVFTFPFEEALHYRVGRCSESGRQRYMNKAFGGYDLGRKRPYVLTIVNDKNHVIAKTSASSRLTELNGKRERLINDKKNIIAKLKHYDALGIDNAKKRILVIEKKRIAHKVHVLGEEIARQVGHEIASTCRKVGADIVAGEDLSWVRGHRYGSRWNFSVQQSWIARDVRRFGIMHVIVNAKDSSSSCPVCGSKVVHDIVRRTSTCTSNNCSWHDDRDFGASWVLAWRCFLRLKKNRLIQA